MQVIYNIHFVDLKGSSLKHYNFAHPYVVPNLCDFLSCVEHERRYFEKCLSTMNYIIQCRWHNVPTQCWIAHTSSPKLFGNQHSSKYLLYFGVNCPFNFPEKCKHSLSLSKQAYHYISANGASFGRGYLSAWPMADGGTELFLIISKTSICDPGPQNQS